MCIYDSCSEKLSNRKNLQVCGPIGLGTPVARICKLKTVSPAFQGKVCLSRQAGSIWILKKDPEGVQATSVTTKKALCVQKQSAVLWMFCLIELNGA